MTDPATLSSREMLRLLGVSSETLRDLVERGIAMPGEHEDTYQLETVTRYCKSLRELARDESDEPRNRAQEFLARIVEDSEDAILSKSLDGTILTWNPAAQQLFGYTAEEVVGQPVTILFQADRLDEEKKILARIRAGERIRHYETVRLKKSGEEIDVSLSISPIRDRTGAIVGASKILRDITAQKRSLARVEQLQAELLHLSRLSAMGQMAATLAHELNQPLSAISNYLTGARKLLSGPGDLTRLDEAVAKAWEQAVRAGEITQRLREFVLKGEISKEWHDLNQVLDESLKLALVGAKPLGVRVETRLDPNIPPVFIDRIQISQVVFNIVRNALDAMQDTPERRLSVTTRSHRESANVELEIADTGNGISSEVAQRLFQPFVTTKASGMGIGLSICRKIVEIHGGTIAATANERGGTAFHVMLPERWEQIS
jgi:two-component system, LuxR family, sensor kinase FixL